MKTEPILESMGPESRNCMAVLMGDREALAGDETRRHGHLNLRLHLRHPLRLHLRHNGRAGYGGGCDG